MSLSDSDFAGREWPDELYLKVSEKLSEQGLRIDRVPDQVHLDALDLGFRSMGTPRKFSKFLLQNDMVQIEDVGRFVEAYQEGIRTLDMKYHDRNEHDRGVDALMQRYADGSEIEDYDILIKNAFFADTDYDPWSEKEEFEDIELHGWRRAVNQVASDADFIGVDLDSKTLHVEEVKKPNTNLPAGIREKKKRRAYNQNQKFVESVREIETPFSVDAGLTYTYSLTNRDYLMPDVFDGNVHVISDLSDRSEEVHEFQELLEQLTYDAAWSRLEPVERRSADPTYLTSSV